MTCKKATSKEKVDYRVATAAKTMVSIVVLICMGGTHVSPFYNL